MCPTRIPVASRDEKGFELMLGMNVQKKAKKIPGSLTSESAFALTASVDITENTRWDSLKIFTFCAFPLINYCLYLVI